MSLDVVFFFLRGSIYQRKRKLTAAGSVISDEDDIYRSSQRVEKRNKKTGQGKGT